MRPAIRINLLTGALLVAWVGAWGTWLAHDTAGLTQTALDLAQVSERLPDVLYGRLAAMPDVLRASIGLSAVVLGVAAGRLERTVLRWALRGLAFILLLRLLPPYPDVLQLWRSPDYGRRFVIALVSLLGLVASFTTSRWPDILAAAVTSVLSFGALVTGIWTFVALERAFAVTVQLSFAPGWGLAVYVVGLVAAMVLAFPDLTGHFRRQSQT